ncbi:hypothetical protein Btru_013383 [Bulinus truncatus]|nr:hypothetical protein Btru_013383 [Bulinus truncatus]
MPHSIEKDFTYNFETKTTSSTLTVPLTIPLHSSPKEFVARLVHLHNLPSFVQHELEDKLEELVIKETNRLHDKKRADEVIQKVKSGEVDENDLIRQWLPVIQNSNRTPNLIS